MRISDWSSDVCSSDLPCGSRSTRQGGREELCVGRTVATRDIAGRSVSISGGVRFSLLKQPESATQRRGHGRQALPPRFRHRSSERWPPYPPRSSVDARIHPLLRRHAQGEDRALRSEERTSEL